MVERPNADVPGSVNVGNEDIDVIIVMSGDLAAVSPTSCAGAHVDHRLRGLERTLVETMSISKDLG